MAEQTPNTGLAWKLVLAFTFSMALIGFAAWYAYDSFNKLLGSVETLSAPDNSDSMLQGLVNSMHAADNDMRNYIMSNDNTSLQSYISTMEHISVELDNLKQDIAFEGQETSLDTLEEYFQDKADLMISLVIFKQSGEYERLNSKAYNKLSTKANESPDISTIQQNVAIKDPTIKQPAIKQPEVTDATSKKKDKKNKDEGFLRNLFSGKNDKKSDVDADPTIVALKDTSSNTNNTSNVTIDLAQTSTVDVEDVRRILQEINKEQRRYNTQLSVKELEILASDKLIIEKIDEVIQRMKIRQQTGIAGQLAIAKDNANASSRTMLIIAAVALLAGLVFMTVILVDIIRSNRYKIQLIEARNRAEYLAKAKEEFLANMSHEIRTPLNAIIGFSEQIEHTPLQPEQKKFIKAVSNAGTHLLNTVNDILDLSKIEAGKLNIDDHTFSIREVIEEVVSILEVKAHEKGLALTTAIGEHADEMVVGDPFRIKQILYNIAGNAIKFTEQGFVEISCSAKKGRKGIVYEIAVKDTGIGIAPDKLLRVFEIFEQAESSITRKYGGTGLGLSISKKLANIMDGDILVNSKPGEGSEFTLHIPLRLASADEIASVEKDKTEYADLSGLEILLVDDEPYNLMLAEVILNKYGAHITTAANGREALDLIDIKSFDIVLADLHMPEVDGYMLANKIRERYLQVPLIALTANVMQNDVERIRTSGFNDILLKPYKEVALLQIISKYAPVVFGKQLLEVPEIRESIVEKATMDLFDLSEVMQFADNDPDVLSSIVEAFITNNKQNVELLRDAVHDYNLDNVRNIAHKMLPSYNHFHVYSIVPELKEMEVISPAANGSLVEKFDKVQHVSNLLFANLRSAITR